MTRPAPGNRCLQAKIPAELHRRLKAEAALRGMTIREAVTEALTAWCSALPPERHTPPA